MSLCRCAREKNSSAPGDLLKVSSHAHVQLLTVSPISHRRRHPLSSVKVLIQIRWTALFCPEGTGGHCFHCSRNTGSGAGHTVLVKCQPSHARTTHPIQLSPGCAADSAIDRSISEHCLVPHRGCNTLELQLLEKLLAQHFVHSLREEICLHPQEPRLDVSRTLRALPERQASRRTAVLQHLPGSLDTQSHSTLCSPSPAAHLLPSRLAAGQRDRRLDMARVPHTGLSYCAT